MNCYLYGFIESEVEKNFGPIGFALGNKEKEIVISLPDKNLAAVVGPPPVKNFGSSNKEQLVRQLLAHQETLETIMKVQFILPCKFGTLLKDRDEMHKILSQSRERLEQWFDKIKNCCEMGVIATWDVKQLLQEIAAKDPIILKLKKDLEKLSPSELCSHEGEAARITVGARLSIRLKEEARRYETAITTKLKNAGEKIVTHALMNDEMVFNASFLLDRREEAGFFKLLETLDRDFEGKLNFKCVGPLPPYSFATVTIQRFETEKIDWAKEILMLKDLTTLDQVKKAYQKRARQCHPDTHSGFGEKEFETLHQAYEFLKSYHRGGLKPVSVSLFNVNGERR
ncbi:MAG: GvpL/GvpF family gas vesicle protein [Deltaproteobacteria bacterium]|nr:GvpL/GvpF family gas vesicle protein [Deltaproteobacteria bacterium]